MSGRVSSLTMFGSIMLLMVSAIGCRPAGELRLFQPQLQGWQRELKLETDEVRWAAATDGVERVLAEFPLPGARTGRATYLLYLRLPAGEAQVVFGSGGSEQAAGFLIQTRGEYAGLSQIKEGTVRVSGKGQGLKAKRHLKIDLTSEDGSQIIGEAEGVRDDYGVAHFENNQRKTDVKALVPPASQPRGG